MKLLLLISLVACFVPSLSLDLRQVKTHGKTNAHAFRFHHRDASSSAPVVFPNRLLKGDCTPLDKGDWKKTRFPAGLQDPAIKIEDVVDVLLGASNSRPISLPSSLNVVANDPRVKKVESTPTKVALMIGHATIRKNLCKVELANAHFDSVKIWLKPGQVGVKVKNISVQAILQMWFHLSVSIFYSDEGSGPVQFQLDGLDFESVIDISENQHAKKGELPVTFAASKCAISKPRTRVSFPSSLSPDSNGIPKKIKDALAEPKTIGDMLEGNDDDPGLLATACNKLKSQELSQAMGAKLVELLQGKDEITSAGANFALGELGAHDLPDFEIEDNSFSNARITGITYEEISVEVATVSHAKVLTVLLKGIDADASVTSPKGDCSITLKSATVSLTLKARRGTTSGKIAFPEMEDDDCQLDFDRDNSNFMCGQTDMLDTYLGSSGKKEALCRLAYSEGLTRLKALAPSHVQIPNFDHGSSGSSSA